MRRVYVSTVQRIPKDEVDLSLPHIYVVDWDTRKTVHQFSGLVPGWSLVSSTGKSHGARGITVFNNKLYIGEWDRRVSWYNLDTLTLEGSLVLDGPSSIHLIRPHKEKLSVVSSKTDAVFRINRNNEVTDVDHVADSSNLLDEYIIKNYDNHKEFSPWGRDRVHFNSINWFRGEEYHVYHGLSMIFNYSSGVPFYYGGPLYKPHDIEFIDDFLVTNSSGNYSTIAIHTETKEVIELQKNEPDVHKWNLWGMTRGLTIKDNFIFAGSTPFTISMFEKNGSRFSLLDKLNIPTEEYQSIFDICLDPNDWKEV